jgi:predicted enzyme related to lactoylglutathione lyase
MPPRAGFNPYPHIQGALDSLLDVELRAITQTHEADTPRRRLSVKLKLELVPIPVANVDRAKAFYVDSLGFVEDVDVRPADGVRVVQMTPPGSACSISIGTGLPAYEGSPPGSVKSLHLVVEDIEEARAELVSRGVDVSPIEDVGGGVKYAEILDPDGNSFVLQEMPWRTGGSY